MNFKPFYIDISRIPYEEVEDILNKSVEAGAILAEDIRSKSYYKYFGVD